MRFGLIDFELQQRLFLVFHVMSYKDFVLLVNITSVEVVVGISMVSQLVHYIRCFMYLGIIKVVL